MIIEQFKGIPISSNLYGSVSGFSLPKNHTIRCFIVITSRVIKQEDALHLISDLVWVAISGTTQETIHLRIAVLIKLSENCLPGSCS